MRCSDKHATAALQLTGLESDDAAPDLDAADPNTSAADDDEIPAPRTARPKRRIHQLDNKAFAPDVTPLGGVDQSDLITVSEHADVVYIPAHVPAPPPRPVPVASADDWDSFSDAAPLATPGKPQEFAAFAPAPVAAEDNWSAFGHCSHASVHESDAALQATRTPIPPIQARTGHSTTPLLWLLLLLPLLLLRTTTLETLPTSPRRHRCAP